MKVFLTGATGVIGRATVAGLVAAGHDVRAVARSPEKADALRAAGVEPVAVDLFDADAVVAAVDGSEAVMHLATNVPPVEHARRKGAWDVHNRLRTEATRNLVAAARAAGATRFVKESVSFVYADGGDRWLTEESPLLEPLGMLAPTIEGEQEALAFAGDGRVATVLRFGLFYGDADNRGTDDMLRFARWRVSVIAGRPGAYMSSIHAHDAASAAVAALGAPAGVFNVVDDEPLTRREHLDAFTAAFGTKRLHLVPEWLFKAIGGSGAAVLLASQRVSNRAFREATGWAPEYPSAREGWRQVAAERKGAVHA
jgi:nucleoside-diphosphate-sugar epimerase